MANNKMYEVDLPEGAPKKVNYISKKTSQPASFYTYAIPDGGLANWEINFIDVVPSKLGRAGMNTCIGFKNNNETVTLRRPKLNADGDILRDEYNGVIRESINVPIETLDGYFQDLESRGWGRNAEGGASSSNTFQHANNYADEDIPF